MLGCLGTHCVCSPLPACQWLIRRQKERPKMCYKNPVITFIRSSVCVRSAPAILVICCLILVSQLCSQAPREPRHVYTIPCCNVEHGEATGQRIWVFCLLAVAVSGRGWGEAGCVVVELLVVLPWSLQKRPALCLSHQAGCCDPPVTCKLICSLQISYRHHFLLLA